MSERAISTPAGPSLRERKRKRAREEIVDAAYQLFAGRPYAEVTVTEIVALAEVSRSTFFRYFGDKQEVVFYDEQRLRDSVIERERERACPRPGDLAAALSQLQVAVVDVYAEAARSGSRQDIHETLIDTNPELYDRYLRKLLGFGRLMEELLCLRGADEDTASLASHIAVACCLAARRPNGHEDPAESIIAQFDQLRSRGDRRSVDGYSSK